MRGERIMTEIVGAELHLETVGRRLPLRQRHHAGIVDQEIERAMSGGEARRLRRLHGLLQCMAALQIPKYIITRLSLLKVQSLKLSG